MEKISYDHETDALYIRIKNATVTTDLIGEGVALDYDEAGQVAGIEILDAGKRLDYRESGKGFGLGVIDCDDQTGLRPSPSLQLSTNQIQVLDALRRVETEEYRLGDWYLGALYALANSYNPDRISQAAQSLRELMEKLPRVVHASDVHTFDFQGMRQGIRERFAKDKNRYKEVWKGETIDARLDKTLRRIDRYLELNLQPTRRDQIQIAIGNIDPMADLFKVDIQKQKRDAFHDLWNQLEGYAHHRSNNRQDERKFRTYVSILERLIYDLLAPSTAQDQQQIKSILDKFDHSDSDAETLYRLVSKRGANYVFFLTNAADPVWIPFLKEKGFFKNPPNAEYLSDGYVRFPFWPELQYLEKVCVHAPEDVLELVLQFPAVDNPRVYDDILDIALKLDGERSGRLKPKLLEYATLETPFLPFQFPQLLAHWTAEGQTEAALEIANIIVQFAPDPKAEEKQKRKIEINEDHTDAVKNQMALMMTTLRPMPRFNENYREILNEGVRPLAEKEPIKVAHMLIDATATMIRMGKHQHELDSGTSSDHSEIWCPRLDRSSDDDPEPGESLVRALTHACEKVYELACDSIEDLDLGLRNQRWNVFKRLRQHLYALHPNKQTRPWIRELILSHVDIGKTEHNYEFQQMTRAACEHLGAELLTPDQRTQIFEAILSGPQKENYRERMGEQFTEGGFERRKRYFHRAQLRLFAPILFGKYADYFQELETDETADEIADEDYMPFRESEGGRVKTRSPKSTRDLANIADEDLLEYINDWEDECWDREDGFTEITIEALAGVFQEVFKDSIIPNEGRINFWIKNRDKILRPIYVRAMINAMQEHVKAKIFDKLDEWFRFCEWVLSHPDPEHKEGVTGWRFEDETRESANWHTSRRAVCDFVEACIEEAVDMPLLAREHLAGLLDILCTQYDWRLDNDRQVLLNRDDQLTEAINTTRGRALENLVNFGLWVRRQDDKADILEMKAILEKRIGTDVEFPLTLPEYAILGMRFGSIFHFDEPWTVSRKSVLFPQNDLPSWREAFGNFLRYNRPYRPIFDELRGDFEFALVHLGSLGEQKGIGRELTLKLGQHLFTYYLWDVYPLKGDQSLLGRYYLKTDGERKHWATLFNYVGHSLRNSGKHLEKGLKDKIVGFFEWRLEAGEPTELREFAAWLKAECLDAEWRLNALSEVLDVDGILDQTGTLEEGRVEHPRTWLPLEATRSMTALLPIHTPRVVECFAKLTNAAPMSGRFYIQTDDAKAILKAGLDHCDETVQKNAKRAEENLFSRGILRQTD